MNDYGFDYLNYITNIPKKMNFTDLSNNNMYNMLNNQPNMNMMKKDMPIDPKEGWMRGNLFANLYDQYKNYKPMELDPKGERETLLYQVMQYKFALIELNLYLDTHPMDTEALNLYNKYLEIEKQMCKKYESMYAPLSLDSEDLENNNWKWIKSPWPWEGV